MDRRDRLAVAGRVGRRASPATRPTRRERLSGSARSTLSAAPQRGSRCRAAARTGPGSGSSRSSGRAGARARSRAWRARHVGVAHARDRRRCASKRRCCRSRGCARARRTRRSSTIATSPISTRATSVRDGAESLSAALPRGPVCRAPLRNRRDRAVRALALPHMPPVGRARRRRACLLAGPTVLAFFSGGYFDEPRLIAAARRLGARAGCSPSPARRRCRPARAGRAGARRARRADGVDARCRSPGRRWAGRRSTTSQRLCSTSARCWPRVGAAARPRARCARSSRRWRPGALVVIGYGLAGPAAARADRPGRSRSAGGRLEQPITYWNAEGALAAIGLVLCARLAGDRVAAARRCALAAAAACAPLGAGRLPVLLARRARGRGRSAWSCCVAAAPTRPQLRAARRRARRRRRRGRCWPSRSPGVAVAEGGAATASATARSCSALLVARRWPPAALLHARAARASASGPARAALAARLAPLPPSRSRPPALCARSAWSSAASPSARARRARRRRRPRRGSPSVDSNRYEYWRVGAARVRATTRSRGSGAGGFRVVWLQERHDPRGGRATCTRSSSRWPPSSASSALLAFGADGRRRRAAPARRALRRQPRAGRRRAAPRCVAWLLHASIDWDWQLPAVTLPALVLAGGLLAASEKRLPGELDAG